MVHGRVNVRELIPLRGMHNYHGSEFDSDRTAIAYLEEKGYELTKDWLWKPPVGITYESMSEEEYRHIQYLIEEWDFGGLVK